MSVDVPISPEDTDTNPNIENNTCILPDSTNQIQGSLGGKVVNFEDELFTPELGEDPDDPLFLLELADLKAMMDETIKFVPAKISICEQKEEELKILEKAGLLIRIDTTTGVCTDSSKSAVPVTTKPIQPIYNPANLKMDWSGVRRIGSGLYNIGNTCFMNSVLQCLTYTPPLANYMFSKDHLQSCKLNGFCAMCQFQKHYLQTQQHYQFGSIKATSIVQYLMRIAPTFQLGRQEDSHEFLRYLIDAMQNSCLGSVSSKIPQELKCTTVIHQIFGGQIRSQVTCFSCSTKSDTYEPMLDFSLNIRGCDTLSDALRRATLPDRLEGNNSYYCDKCKRKVSAEKILSIHCPPRVLTIHLKRFSFGNQLGFKIQNKVCFPTALDVRDYMTDKGPPVTYKLYAVLVHSGYTCNSGHYYCYVIAPNGTWHKMNDTYVAPVALSMVQSSEAYMLFYKMTTPTKPKPATSLSIEGLTPNEPSPLSTNSQLKNTPTNILPIKYKVPGPMLSRPQGSSATQTPSRFQESPLKNPISKPSFFHSLSSLTSDTNAIKVLVEKNSNKNRTETQHPSNQNGMSTNAGSPVEDLTNQIQDKMALKQSPNQDPDKENSTLATETSQKNATINSYKANTTKPLAVVTPKQPDKPISTISSTSVHKSNTFRSPSNKMTKPSFYKKSETLLSPNYGLEDVADKVREARKVKPFRGDKSADEETPIKRRKLNQVTSPQEQRVSPLKINFDTCQDEVQDPCTDPPPIDTPHVNKSFSITGVKGVKPTGIITPLDNSRNLPKAKNVQIEVSTPVLKHRKKNSKERESASSKGPRKHIKNKFLKRLCHTEGDEMEKYVIKALKREIFPSREDLEKELRDFKKSKKHSKSKKLKKKRRIISESEDDNKSLSVFDLPKSPEHNKQTPKHNKNKNHKVTSIEPHSKNSTNYSLKSGSELVEDLKNQSFKQLGGKLKPWDKEQQSVLQFMNCDEKKDFSDSEFDLELDRGKVPKRKNRHLSSRKSLSKKFQQEYDRNSSLNSK